jgi:hypothetical protein
LCPTHTLTFECRANFLEWRTVRGGGPHARACAQAVERAGAAEQKLAAARRAHAALEAEHGEQRGKLQAAVVAVRDSEARLTAALRRAAELEAALAARAREAEESLAAAAAARTDGAAMEGRLTEAYGRIGELEFALAEAGAEAERLALERAAAAERVERLGQEVRAVKALIGGPHTPNLYQAHFYALG